MTKWHYIANYDPDAYFCCCENGRHAGDYQVDLDDIVKVLNGIGVWLDNGKLFYEHQLQPILVVGRE